MLVKVGTVKKKRETSSGHPALASEDPEINSG